MPAGSLVEVTCKTIQGRLLMCPSAALTEATLGILGRAQRRYAMQIHAFTFLSNHYHMLLTAADAEQLSRFMGFVQSALAREAGRLAGWKEKFWGRRYQAIVVSHEEAAQLERLRYLLAQGCKEGLVGAPAEWPGCSSLIGLLTEEPLKGRWFDRSAEYEARRLGREPAALEFATDEFVGLTPLPCLMHQPPESRRRIIEELVSSIAVETKKRCEESLRQPLGPEAVRVQRPDAQPVRSKKSPAPFIHAASRRVRLAFLELYRQFVEAFREAARRLRSGDRSAEFPPGSFPPALRWVPEPAPP